MKTQISGYSDRPERRYSGVYQQQGRMLLDADANELVDILKRSLAGIVSDAAMVGAPRRDGVVGYAAGVPAVRPGLVYADGLRAELKATGDPYTKQLDFPSPPALPAGDHVLYVDVWERPVTALEDAALIDPALHGADTCTRTQMMAQLKWCPPAAAPPFACDLLSENPPRGNAELEVGIREVGSGTPDDPCDPCAEEVAPEARLGNYLFRLEVHDVEGPASAPTKVVLKWSSENASESYELGAEPLGYGRTDRLYELFDKQTDSVLGVHLATGYKPPRGKLSVALPTTGGQFVRRWDGGCTLTRGPQGWALSVESDGGAGEPAVIGRDRGARLVLAGGPGLPDNHGAALVGEKLQLSLQNLTLRLRLKDRSFVAGDYWLAVVRERAESARRADLVDTLPVGIVHHYTTLGLVKNGKLQLDADDRRRFSFPPLTDIRAEDVGYDNSACALVGGTETVKDALDRLCGLDATHVAYDNPNCASGLLAGADTVEEALDALCGLEAKHVAFDGDIPGATDVEQALDELWDIARSGEDVCSALLALFGRGVVCGLIPAVRATVLEARGASRVTLTATTSAGTAVNGRGCVRTVPALTVNRPMGMLGGGEVALDADALERLSNALEELSRGGRTITGIEITRAQAIRVREIGSLLVERVEEASPVSDAEMREIVAGLGVSDRRLAAELVAQIRAAAGDQPGVAETDDLWLYLVDPVDDEPSLEVRTTAPAGFPIDDAVRQAMLAPGDGPKVGAGSACPTAYDEAWSVYQRISCPPRADDGAVCLGRIGVKGDRAWVSPDDREQLFPTPAHTVSHWRSQRLRVHDKLKQACTAGPPTLQSLEGADGRSLDGRAFLADGSARTGVVRLGGPALGQAVAIDLAAEAGITVTPARVAIAPGDSSAVFTFTLAAGAAGTPAISATVVGDAASRRTARLTAAGIAAPATAAGPLAGARVLAGESVTVTVGLTTAVSHPVTLRARASGGVELRPPLSQDVRNESDVALAPGQKSATITLEVLAGRSGPRELRVIAGSLDVPASFTAVALNTITKPDGSALQGSSVDAGGSLAARVALTGPAPHDVTVTLSAQAGLTVPATIAVSANQAASGNFTVTAAANVEGQRTITASLFGHSVSVTVTVNKPKDDIDEKNSKDNKDDKDDQDTKDKETSPQKEIRDDRKLDKDLRDGTFEPLKNVREELPIAPIEPIDPGGIRRPFIARERRPDLL